MTDEPNPSSTYRPRCMLIRCKSMLVFGENFEQDPEYQAGSVGFWCNQTGRGLGPDNGEVSMECCTDPERTCFQEY